MEQPLGIFPTRPFAFSDKDVLFVEGLSHDIQFNHYPFFVLFREYFPPPSGSHVVGYPVNLIATYKLAAEMFPTFADILVELGFNEIHDPINTPQFKDGAVRCNKPVIELQHIIIDAVDAFLAFFLALTERHFSPDISQFTELAKRFGNLGGLFSGTCRNLGDPVRTVTDDRKDGGGLYRVAQVIP